MSTHTYLALERVFGFGTFVLLWFVSRSLVVSALMCFSLYPALACMLSHALFFLCDPFCLMSHCFCLALLCDLLLCVLIALYLLSTTFFRVGGGLAMITTWVSLRYVWVLSSNTNFEETN